jgi:Rne/Rng family ribonuclease
MAKEICISSTPHETRLAILEDDQLAEIYYERENEYTLAGSVYNGRVTRVLPGMQSAFVDIGLERDAFLYVTDFLELEDQEETDELEKATASAGSQPPREVRHGGDRTGQRPGQKSDQKPEPRPERPARGRRPAAESAPETGEAEAAAPQSLFISEQTDETEESTGEPGAKRWRGRRRRRGGRGSADTTGGPGETERSSAAYPEAAAEPETAVTHEIHAAAGPAPRADRAPAPFVLPGESLSRYGGAPAEPAQKSAAEPREPAVPARPAVTFRPATLVEAPLEWDGSGLLPGESLSKHGGRQREVESEPQFEVESEPQFEVESAPQASFFAPEGSAREGAQVHFVEEELTEETSEAAPEAFTVEAPATEPEPDEAEPVAAESAEPADEEPEPDATASHHVDPAPPTGFRIFGLGGKKKKTDEPAKEAGAAPRPASVASVSAFAPGSGLVEEEVIEGEEVDTPGHHPHHKGDDHDLDEYEEETLQTQIRSGALGEMLQEAHLDHRIQLDFDEKNGEDEEEEGFEGEEEEEEPVSAEGQPAGEGAAQPRRDRGGRGRRNGRGGKEAQGTGARRGPSRRSMQTSDLPIISDLLKPGQEILVQIAKEPIAKKGARITSHIALPGRFLVFMPTVSHVGVSRKIASDEERQRLKRILVSERGEASGGFIVRTAAEGASEEDLRADLRFLIHLWNEIKTRSDSSKSPALIYHDLSLIERILRDQVSANFSSIWVDSEADYERIVRFLNRFSPNLVRRVKLYTKEVPLFEHFGIQDEISKALRSKVWLKSGGSIVINQTEALVAIDINTGKYVGKSARLEDTIVKTNLDAVPEIVRQIRLRDLGGIIIIDFIDMDERKNRFRVMAALEEALKSDRAPTKVLQFNDFGLVAITRKRVKQSLERTLSVPCPVCQATGMVKSPTTVCNEVYIEMRKMRKHFESADVLLRVHPETVKVLKSNNGSWLTEFEELTGKNILVKSDATLHPEQFDIQG